MKKIAFITILIHSCFCIYSQNVGIGNNNPQSKLHVSGAIRSDTLIYTGPAVRHVFSTPNGRIYDSLVVPAAADWLINGNANIGLTNFLGTTNANDLIFRTNNIEVARFTAASRFGIGTAAPDISALVEMVSTTGGLLIPRMTTAQRTAIATPANGLLVYDLTINCLFFYNAALTAWQSLCAPPLPPGTNDVSGTYPALTVVGLQTTPVAAVTPTTGQILQFNGTSWTPTNGTFWNLLGNAGTVPATNFLGTTDNVALVFRTNNIEQARFENSGLFHNMQGAFINTIGSDGQGANSSAGGGASLFWRLNNGGYAGSFYNQSLLGNANGLMVKILGTAASNTIFDASTGVQGTAGAPVLTAKGNGFVGVGTNNPRGKFDVLNGDAYIADNVFAAGNFAVGRSATIIFADNIKPYTDNSLRIYDNNSNSHITFDANTNGVIQFYTPAGSAPPALENVASTGVLAINPYGGFVGVGTTAPQAYLDVVSTANGFAMPRMTSAQRKAIVAPVAGVQVYDTNLLGFYYWDGTKWDCANNPAGTVQYFANTTAPNGYLECNGAAVNRITYAELFAAIGITYGPGDGVTTFNLPDLRGEFVRGFDNGKGSDPGRTIGTWQSPSPLIHDDTPGAAAQDTDFSMDNAATTLSDPWPTVTVGSIPNAYWGRGNAASPVANWVVYAGAPAQGMISASRPRNVALMPCIKF
ncbi:MAG: phage tail protein [Bacteroidota bacterium]|nr:phage tail protein [Bacteroidota bacterium]